MSYLSRSLSPEVIKQIIDDFLEHNLKLIEISHKYEADYHDLRGILRREFKTKHLLRHRRVYRESKYGVQQLERNSKQIDVVLALLFEKCLSYADIARKLNISRERVGQIAKLIADRGISVAREGAHSTRGIAA
jgi:DNA-directed RNA polymerase specialized sigma subunit